MTKIKGIDVSQWQGRIDWEKVKADGIEFAILRAGYGRVSTQKDPYFEDNYKAAKAAGIKIGAYHYSYAKTVADAKQEAKTFLAWLKGKQFEYPVCFDIEDECQKNLSIKTCSDITRAFCEEVEKAGYYVAVYSFKSFLESKLDADIRSRYDIWVAHTGVSETSYKGQFGMWQYSHKGTVSGITGDVDLNYAYKDYPAIMKANGLNGFKTAAKQEIAKPVTKPTTNKTESKPKEEAPKEVTYTVVSGDYLLKIARKYNTTVAKLVADNKKTYPRMTANYIQVGWNLKIK